MINKLRSGRVLSIDAFRGITILVMIFVNALAGVNGIPSWMKHAHADDDAMTFVDAVFPAFLFIVGMSIPFAINNRLAKGDNWQKIQYHILWRTLGLLVLGVFMVNTESLNPAATGMPLPVWALLFYICAILVWNVYTFKQARTAWYFKGAGIAGLVILGVIYRGGESGQAYLTPHWWGILGLLGWAYLYACIIYQLFKGTADAIFFMIGVCIGFYILCQQSFLLNSQWRWLASQAVNAAHTSIVLSGVLLTLFFFDEEMDLRGRRLLTRVCGFLTLTMFISLALRPGYKISKIHATPSWCLNSIAICIAVFSLLYYLIDVKGISKWTAFLRPAGSNPLLTYILPDITFYLLMLLGIHLPAVLSEGTTGIIWCMCFAVLMLWLVKGLNKLHIRLQL
ncbi:DUF5009 domain-containing protein [Chitinophaga vietnamensis]|uniref:DUF5009 domain-containing protein n=1 Tax=Chitinophaga vietnamensis TaxID=2593957 RepID=UPI0011781597|nr:DUF5009 domain-containing protein [Chitinophaga vietnamensis]